MSAAEWLFVVDVTVAAEVEDEWNAWYDDEHLPAIAACPGVLSADRYVSDTGGGRRYLTLYALEGPAALDTAEFRAARGWYRFTPHVQATVRLYHHRSRR